MTPEQKARLEALEKAAKPLVDFLYEFGTPHDKVVVTQANSELFRGECCVPNPLRDLG